MIFFRKKQLDPPAALPDLARDIYEKKESDEKAAAVLDGAMESSAKLFEEKQIKEPTATPPSMYSQAQQPQQTQPQQPVQSPLSTQSPFMPYPLSYPQSYPLPYPVGYPLAMPYPTVLPWHQGQAQQQHPQVPASSSAPEQGFFHSVEHAILRGEHGHVRDALTHMKKFYVDPSPKDESQYLQASITRTLAELKDLERVWRETKESLEAMERDCLEKEREIEHKATELKLFLDHLKRKVPQRTAPREQWFHCMSGETFASIISLKEALPGMSDAVFAHHVTPERNDFSSWVRDVFAEFELAERIRQARSKVDLYALLDAVL